MNGPFLSYFYLKPRLDLTDSSNFFLMNCQLTFELEIRHQNVQEHFTPPGPVSSLDLPNHLIPTFCISHDVIKKFMTGEEVFFQIDLKLTMIKNNINSDQEES